MKKLICAMLALILCAGTAMAEAPGVSFGFEMLREMGDGEQNLVISPLSAAAAMAMAAQGAEGETKQQILDALGLTDPIEAAELQESLAETGLRQANAAFLPGGMEPKTEYISDLEQLFGAKWFYPEETNVDAINGWIEDITDGMIEKMIGELPEEAMLILVNAIAMDAKWAVPFIPENNSEKVFHAPDGDVNVTFMNKEFYADYGERENVQLLRLNYRDCGLSMLIALPETGGVQNVLDGLCADGLGYFTFEEEAVKVDLSMPKTDITVSSDLRGVLCQLGVKTAFSDNADFPGITEEMPIKIDSVIQKARLILDEEGTRAAAATAVMMAAYGMPMPEVTVDFCMDRPFVFVIADETSGAVCFAGIVANPAEIN